jgi:hypothetical protein
VRLASGRCSEDNCPRRDSDAGDERRSSRLGRLPRVRLQPAAAAERVLRLNDNGGYTVPSRSTYPHQWNWDSALAALGWAELDCDRA